MTILDDSRSDWWKAELNGKVGMVPAKYVEIRPENTPTNPAAVATAGAASSGVTPGVNPGVPAPAKAPAAPVAVQRLMAMQFFKSPRPDILGLEPGMEMTLLGKPSPDWWKVELRGKVGLVPAKLVQPLVRPQEVTFILSLFCFVCFVLIFSFSSFSGCCNWQHFSTSRRFCCHSSHSKGSANGLCRRRCPGPRSGSRRSSGGCNGRGGHLFSFAFFSRCGRHGGGVDWGHVAARAGGGCARRGLRGEHLRGTAAPLCNPSQKISSRRAAPRSGSTVAATSIVIFAGTGWARQKDSRPCPCLGPSRQDASCPDAREENSSCSQTRDEWWWRRRRSSSDRCGVASQAHCF